MARFSLKKPNKFFAVRLTIAAFPKTGVLSSVSDGHCIHICHLGVQQIGINFVEEITSYKFLILNDILVVNL